MTTTSTKRSGIRRSAVLVAAAATLLFACSSDGQSPLSTAELPAPEQPAPEEPVEDDGGLTSEQWIIIVLGGVAMLFVMAALR